MTRFFVQLLLTVIVSVGASLSVSPVLKAELQGKLQEAGASLRGTANVAVTNIGDMTAKINTAMSVKANIGTSPGRDKKTDIKVKSDLNAIAGNGYSTLDDLLSNFSLTGTLTNESRTDVEADVPGLEVDLKDRTRSTLDVDLDPGE